MPGFLRVKELIGRAGQSCRVCSASPSVGIPRSCVLCTSCLDFLTAGTLAAGGGGFFLFLLSAVTRILHMRCSATPVVSSSS